MAELDDSALENAKIAVAFRAGRAAIGWSQQEFADKLDVAKSTVARIETLESAASAAVYMRAMKVFEEAGVPVSIRPNLGPDIVITFYIESKALKEAARRLADEHLRRADRKRATSK